LSSVIDGFKRVGLHYITFSEHHDYKDKTSAVLDIKIAEFGGSVTNFG